MTANFSGLTLTNSDASSSDTYMVKYNADGQPIWANRIGGAGHQEFEALKTDAAGNVYVVCSTNTPNIIIGNATYNNVGLNSKDVFVIKYNSMGQVQWVRPIGTAANELITDLEVSPDGHLLFNLNTAAESIALGTLTVSTENGRASIAFKES